MLKRINVLVISLLIVLGLVMVGCQQQPPEAPSPRQSVVIDGVTYTLQEDQTYKITAFDGYKSELIIPQTVDGLPISAVGNGAFSSKKLLKNIMLPQTVTTVEYSAFTNCKLLSRFVAPGLQIIEETAFSSCNNLTIFDFSTVKFIGKNAFSSSGLTGTINLDSVEYIEQCAFSYCSYLSDVVTGQQIKRVYLNSFEGCASSLSSVEFANNQQEWCLWLTYVGGNPGWWDNDNVVSGTIPWKQWIKQPTQLANLLTRNWNDGSFICTRAYRNQFPNG